MDMECALHRSENEIEDENQLNLAEAIDSLTTSSNLKKKSKNKKRKNIQEKEYEVLEKLGKSLMEEDDADDVFGKMVATKMKSMSAHMKFHFK